MHSIYIAIENSNIIISHAGFGSEFLFKSEVINSFVHFCLTKFESDGGFIENEVNKYNCDTCQSSFQSLYNLQKHFYFKEDFAEKRQDQSSIENCDYSNSRVDAKELSDFTEDKYIESVEKSVESHPASLNLNTNEDKHLVVEEDKSNIKYEYVVVQNLKPKSNKLICQFCKKQFTTTSYLKYHQFSVHSFPGKKSIHLCTHCGKKYYYRSQLNNHLIIHESSLEFNCHLCQKSFKTNQGLQRHVKSHNVDKDYLCNHCNKRFKIHHSLVEHVLHKHTQERPFSCSVCNKSYATKNKLRKHRVQHLKPKISRAQRLIFECSSCGRVCKDRYTLAAHQRIHSGDRPFGCKYCGKTFTYKHHVQKHMKNLFCLKTNTSVAWVGQHALGNSEEQFMADSFIQSVVSS